MSRISKTDQKIIIGAILLLLLVGVFLYDDSIFNFSSDDHLKKIGEIHQFDKDVRLKTSKQFNWDKAADKKPVHIGDSLFTGDKSTATVGFNDGSKIKIQQNSLIVFNNLGNQMSLNLKEGQIVSDLKDNAHIKIKFKNQTLELVGAPTGQFEVKEDGKVNVISGKIDTKAVADDTPEEEVAPPPQEVVEKFEPLQITAPVQGAQFVLHKNLDNELVDSNIIDVNWDNPNGKNTKYEIELSQTDDFTQVIYKTVSTAPTAKTNALESGDYYVRVRDLKHHPETWSNAVLFSIDILSGKKLETPNLLTKKMVYFAPSEADPQFKWTPVAEAQKYLVEVSMTPEFKEAKSYVADQADFNFKDYASAKYYFRVAAATAKGHVVSNWSDTGDIQINSKKPVTNPVKDKVVMLRHANDQIKPEDFNLSWSKVNFADSYQIEISKDKDFKHARKIKSRDPASVVQMDEPGNYVWRVQPIDNKGEPLTKPSEPGLLNFVVKFPLVAPVLVEPEDKMTYFLQSNQTKDNFIFWLQWLPVKQAASYKVQFSTDPSFKDVIYSEESKDSKFLVKNNLPDGHLFWRIRAEADNGRISDWSMPRELYYVTSKTASNE